MNILNQTAADVEAESCLDPVGLQTHDVSFPFEQECEWWAAECGEFDPETPGPGEPQLPFADWIGVQASYFRSLNSNAADWLAAELDELADQARQLGAETPDQLSARRFVMDGRDERHMV